MLQANEADSIPSQRVSGRIRLRKKQPNYAEVDEDDDEDDPFKKPKRDPILIPQPSNIIEGLPSQLFAHMTSFLDPNGLIRLSFAAKSIYAIIDDSMWNEIIQKHCKGPAFKWKRQTPRRELVIELTAKRTCQHCKGYFDENLKSIRCRTKYYGKRLCTKCFNMPIYKEISESDAQKQFGLTIQKLLTLRFRRVMTFDDDGQYSYPRKMYNLQQVMDLAKSR